MAAAAAVVSTAASEKQEPSNNSVASIIVAAGNAELEDDEEEDDEEEEEEENANLLEVDDEAELRRRILDENPKTVLRWTMAPAVLTREITPSSSSSSMNDRHADGGWDCMV